MFGRLIPLLAICLWARVDSLAADEPVRARATPEALNFANALYRDRRYDLAAEEFEAFLKSAKPGPDAWDARFGMANARLFLGRYQQAREAFETVLRELPENHEYRPAATFRVGETAYLLGDRSASRNALETFTAKYPGHRYAETAWAYLGDVLLGENDLAKARKAYEKVLTFPGGQTASRASYGLGRVLGATGEIDRAVEVLESLAKTGGPEWAERSKYEAGRLLHASGKDARAVETLQSLETLAPRGRFASQAKLLRGESLIRLGRADEAERLLEALANDQAQSQTLAAQAASTLGASRLTRGDAELALNTFDDAVKRFGATPLACYLTFQSAEALSRLNRREEALARYLKAAELDPNDPAADDAFLRAAGLALDLRDLARARELSGALPNKFPKSPLIPDARLIEGRALLTAGQAKEAIRLIEASLAADHPSPAVSQAARYYLGLAYRADGRADKSAEVLDALAKTPAAAAAVDARFMLGQGHVEAGKFAEAIPALESYLAGKPNGEVADYALAHLAHARIELGRFDEARAAVEELAKRFPKSKALDVARIRVAEALLASRKYEPAAELFRAASQAADPAVLARAKTGLGWALLKLGKAEQAAEAFQGVDDKTKDASLAPEAAFARAQALEQAGKTSEALEAYAATISKFPDGPNVGRAGLAKARLLVAAKRPAEAAEAFSAVIERHLKSAGEPLDGLLAEYAWALIDAEKPAEADVVFARLLKDFPESPKSAEARFNLAESAFLKKNLDEVDSLLRPLLEVGAKVSPVLLQSALYRSGRTRVERKDWANAVKTLQRLIDEHPDGRFLREARFWKAESLFQSGDAKSAESEFVSLAAEVSKPTDPPGFVQSAKRRRVQSLIVLERWKDALVAGDAFKAEFPADPGTAEIDFARGRALQGLARFDEARTAYDLVIVARRGEEIGARARFMRGETYFHQTNYKDALKEFLRVSYLDDHPTWQAAAMLEAGKVHERLSQWTEAAETYERLRSEFPTDPRASDAEARLTAVKKRVADTKREDSGRF